MGLDMYLTRKMYVKNWEHTPKQERFTVTVKRGGKPVTLQNVKYIEEEVGYWRKANHIHAWFVDHVQGGKDDCNEYYVSKKQLAELLSLVNNVLANHDLAPELLPTQSGFFFGDTNYSEYYFEDLELTKNIIESLLTGDTTSDREIYYRSSW